MTDGVTTNIDALRKALSDLGKVIESPRQSMEQIGLILKRGFEMQWETDGSHWGSGWAGPTEIMEIFRRWQGYKNYTPMTATGSLRGSFDRVVDSDGKGVSVGTHLAYAVNMHKGIASGEMAILRSKRDPSKAIHHVFRQVTARPIIPTSGGQITNTEQQQILEVLVDALTDSARSASGV